jgi:Fur family zinc uptake transcriptional regulator
MGKTRTTTQSQILQALQNQQGPLSAYELLDTLRQSNPKVAPPTVYRALSALTERGSVHRLESLNAYVACQCAGHDQTAVLAICDDCGLVEETVAPEILSALSGVTGKSGFATTRHVIEVHGHCASCTGQPA